MNEMSKLAGRFPGTFYSVIAGLSWNFGFLFLIYVYIFLTLGDVCCVKLLQFKVLFGLIYLFVRKGV